MKETMIERVAREICKSRTCEGFQCCEWPSQMGRKHDCPVTKGYYDDAARAAISAVKDSITPTFATDMMSRASYINWEHSEHASEEWYGDYADFKCGWDDAFDAALHEKEGSE